MDDKYDNRPCGINDFDHNGECLICDCWPSDCAYKRYIDKDYKWETKEELAAMYDPWIKRMLVKVRKMIVSYVRRREKRDKKIAQEQSTRSFIESCRTPDGIRIHLDPTKHLD